MRIAIFADNFYPELSGIADTILATGKELAKKGHRVTYFVPKYSKKEFDIAKVEYKELALHKNITIKRVKSFGYPTATKQGRATLPNIFRGFFYRNKFDVVHTHSFFAFGIEAYFFAKINKIPLIGTNHTIIESFLEFAPAIVRKHLPKYLIWFYNHCIYVTVPSEFLLKKMEKEGLVVESEVISNPIEKEFFISKKDKIKLQKLKAKKKLEFLYAGRLSSEKNVEIIVDAFSCFIKKDNYNETELVLLGNGTLKKTLSDKIKKHNLGQSIKIKGPFIGKNKKILYEEFNLADVFIIASTSDTQSMGLLQSQASSMPAIVANSEPLPQLVSDGRGLVFNTNDKKDLLDKIKIFNNDVEIRNIMADNAYNYSTTYSVSNIAIIWEKLYKEIIKKYENSRK